MANVSLVVYYIPTSSMLDLVCFCIQTTCVYSVCEYYLFIVIRLKYGCKDCWSSNLASFEKGVNGKRQLIKRTKLSFSIEKFFILSKWNTNSV